LITQKSRTCDNSTTYAPGPKMSNRVKRDVRLEVAPGALGVTFEADYNGCAGKFFQHTHQMHDKNVFSTVSLHLYC